MKWVGLTGGIASGKTAVVRYLKQLQVPIVDADRIVHQFYSPGSEVYQEIVAHFGAQILGSDKQIDRHKLAEIVFASSKEKNILESIVHPRVKEEVKKIRKELKQQGHPLAVYDVPLLFEKSIQGDFDSIALVYCTKDQQIERLMKRNHFTRDEAIKRIDQQLPLDEKKKLADYIIDNTGDLNDLDNEVKAWLQHLQ